MNNFPINMNAMNSMPMSGMNNIQMQPPTRNASGQQPNSTLYVGNLDSDLDEQRLYEYFSHYGPVNNVRIMRDLYSGESRGFAFVNYASAADAKRAKLVLNHTKVQDNEIRISFKRNPADIDHKANLYISNLDSKVRSRELEEMCSEYGSVVSCVVREDGRGGSLGYGYVQFENEKDAQACIQGINNNKIYEKEISVQVFVPRSKRASPVQRNNLYLKGFPTGYTEEQVKDFINKSFSEFGTIDSIGVFLDNKINRYYAFVAFKQGEEARNAVQNLNGHDFDDTEKLYVDFAQQKGQRRKMLKQKHMKYKNETNLYIRSLRPGVTEAEFRAAFEKYGTINSICLKKHSFPQRPNAEQPAQSPDNKELAFGFVNFPKTEEAKAAFTEGKKDADILALIDPSHNEKTEFIFYAQPAGMRKQYLRMIKKNYKATQIMQNNLLMMTQNAMKMMKMSGKGGFRQQGNRGPKFGGKRGMRDNNMMGGMPFMGGMPPMVPMNMMMNNMGMSPQMMMMQQQQQNMMQMNPMMMQHQMMQQNNNQQQLAGAQQLLTQTQPTLQAQPQAQPQVQAQVPAQVQPQATSQIKDFQWLKTNLAEFESMSQGEKKNILGTLMYNKIRGKAAEPLVPKITGMLIDLDVLSIQEIIEILSDDAILQERINEARNIIEDDNNGN